MPSHDIASVAPQRVPHARSGFFRTGLLSAALAFLIGPITTFCCGAVAEAGDVRCGTDIVVRPNLVRLAPGELRRTDAPSAGEKTTDITLNARLGLASHPEALSAWRSAVAIWESWLEDPISVTLVGDLEPLPENVLGSTTPLGFIVSYTDIRNALVADAGTDEGVVALVPSLANLNTLLPPGFTFGNTMALTMANLKALGLSAGPFDEQPDAEIVFSTSFLNRFDFDPSNGIDPDKIDFQAVVVHEIGHALGFSTVVDLVDYLRARGQTETIPLYPLDCFRLLPDQGARDFAQAARALTTGDLQSVQVFFDGTTDIAMSTGLELGDGKQASHWKDDQLTGFFIGIMDPTLSPGSREELTARDLRAFGLIGWDVAAEPHEPPDPGDPPPDRFAVTSVYPNPFNPLVNLEFIVEFNVPVAAEARLDVFDLRGRLVAQVGPFVYGTGLNRITWNGATSQGKLVGSGAYFLRLVTGLGYEIRRVMLLK